MISKIDGPGGVRPTAPAKRAGKTSGTDSAGFSKALDEASETGGTAGLSGTNAVTGVLGLQEVDDATAHASKGKRRAVDILDRLDELRIELLTGTISKEKLLQLARIVNARKDQVTDPHLKELLEEVDLRAQVELAKHAP